jgi:hypothetical protein
MVNYPFPVFRKVGRHFDKKASLQLFVAARLAMSGRLDSNQRPPEPHSGALAKLRHAPVVGEKPLRNSSPSMLNCTGPPALFQDACKPCHRFAAPRVESRPEKIGPSPFARQKKS